MRKRGREGRAHAPGQARKPLSPGGRRQRGAARGAARAGQRERTTAPAAARRRARRTRGIRPDEVWADRGYDSGPLEQGLRDREIEPQISKPAPPNEPIPDGTPDPRGLARQETPTPDRDPQPATAGRSNAPTPGSKPNAGSPPAATAKPTTTSPSSTSACPHPPTFEISSRPRTWLNGTVARREAGFQPGPSRSRDGLVAHPWLGLTPDVARRDLRARRSREPSSAPPHELSPVAHRAAGTVSGA